MKKKTDRREYKLLFCGLTSKFPVIANQSTDWCGNPPVEWYQVTITTENRSISSHCKAIIDTFPF